MILEEKILATKMNADRQQKNLMVRLRENGLREFVLKDVFGKAGMCTGIKTQVVKEAYLAKQSVEEVVSELLICIVIYVFGILVTYSKTPYKNKINFFYNNLIRSRRNVVFVGYMEFLFKDM